jgi:hypothetical protein
MSAHRVPSVSEWPLPKPADLTEVKDLTFESSVGEDAAAGRRYIGCVFDHCRFDAGLRDCHFVNCRFIHCNFVRRTVRNVWAADCEFEGCLFFGTQLRNFRTEDCAFIRNRFNGFTLFDNIRLFRADDLETNFQLHVVRIGEGESKTNIETDLAIYAETKLRWPEKYLSWERLRTMGKLPLFGISYSVLITVPVLLFALAIYNKQITSLRELAAPGALADNPEMHLVRSLLAKLHTIPVPDLTLWLIVVTLLLAIASTLYTLVCPARVKEFSVSQWTDELGLSSLQYLPLSWSRRMARLVSGACYAIGGAGALIIILVKIATAIRFLLTNSYW